MRKIAKSAVGATSMPTRISSEPVGETVIRPRMTQEKYFFGRIGAQVPGNSKQLIVAAP